MRRRLTIGMTALLSTVALLAGGLAPAQGLTGDEIVEPPASPLDEIWEAPADAGGTSIPASDAPTDAWEAPEKDRSLPRPGGATAKAPPGTPVGKPGLGELPYYSFDEIELATDTVARVNLGNGNLLLTANDGILNGPALSARNDRFYNGLSSSNGSFGGGWSSPLSSRDVGLAVTTSQATYTGANGFTALFTKNSGGAWVAPAGFKATLVTTGTGSSRVHTLTYNETGEKLLFNSTGWLTANQNRNGEGTTYTYNPSNGRISTVYEASGRSYAITWAVAGGNDVISSITDSASRTTTYTSNSSGQLTKVESPGGRWHEFSYDSTGRLSEIRTIGTAGASTHTKTVFEFDTSHRVTAIKRGLVSSSTFSTTTTYAYTSGLTTVTDGNGHASTYAIDASGRVTSATNANGNARSQTWTANGDIATTTDAFASGSTPGNSTTYSYDTIGNATGVSLPTGAAASATYATGTGCAGTGGTTFQPKCSTDAAGNGKKYDYDTNGNLTGTTDTTTGGTGAVTQSYTYETAAGTVCGGFAGQICTAKDGKNNVTSYDYDTSGNLTLVDAPAPQGDTSYTYDSLGRVLTVTDGNGDTTTYAYNVRDDIVLTTFDNGVTLTTEWYVNGLKARDSDSTGPASIFYWNELGLQRGQQNYLVSGGAVVTGSTISMNFTYDAAGNSTSYEDSSYGLVTYVYDDANQLKQIIEPGGSCATGTGSAADSGCVKIDYNANGAETKRTYPGNATVTQTIDNSGRPTRITAKDGAGVTKVDIGYSYTAASAGLASSTDRTSIVSRTSYAEQGITAGAVTSYTYDSLNRVTAAVEKVGTTTSASWTYAYDKAGNRTQQVRAGTTGATAGTINYTYNAANRIASTSADTTTWTYDAAGNQTRNGITGQTATYNSQGAVTGIGTTTYSAMGQGNTLQQTRSADTTSYLNTSLGLSAEKFGFGGSRAFTRDSTGDATSARLSGGSRYYYAKDSLGSVVGLFDKTGTYLGGYSYSPYGEARSTGTNQAVSTNNNLRYTGGYFDSASGLYKFGARFYDPGLGRFTQFDPSGQETNPYSYTSCNPVNATDPTGLVTAACIWSVIALVGASLLVAQQIIAAFAATAAPEPALTKLAAAGIITGLAGTLLVQAAAGYAVTATC